MSPELRERRPSDQMDLQSVKRMILSRNVPIDGVTISGGEPFEQSRDLCRLVEFLVSDVSEDILVYTGWDIDEVRNDYWGNLALASIATLIDGEYIETLDDGKGLRGSRNQNVYRLGGSIPFDYESADRKVQTFLFSNKAFVVGVG